MATRFTEFLVNPGGQSPRNLMDSIRRVGDASAGFRELWGNGDVAGALDTSQVSFENLDYIQSELLRQRDARRNDPGWHASPVKLALGAQVGRIVEPVADDQEQTFLLLPQGAGAIPSGNVPLVLEKALNKLKHRSTVAVNFAVPVTGEHLLYALTPAGLGQPATLCEINVSSFLEACRAVAQHVS